MSFATLNGLAVSLSSFQAADPTEVGERARAFDGTYRLTLIASKRKWTASMVVQKFADADTWAALCRGLGDVYPLSADTWSAKGSTMTGSGTAPTFTGSGPFGLPWATFAPYTSGLFSNFFAPISDSTALGGGYTLLWYQSPQAGGTTLKYAWTFDGNFTTTLYLGGTAITVPTTVGSQFPAIQALSPSSISVHCPVAGSSFSPRGNSTGVNTFTLYEPATPNGYLYNVTVAGTTAATYTAWPTTYGTTFTDGTATIQCAGSKNALIQQLVMIPACMSAAQVAAWASLSSLVTANQWIASPRLTLSGDVLNGKTVAVVPTLTSDKISPFFDSTGTYQGNARVLEIQLDEV